MHVIAAKAVAFGEALQPEFKEYAAQIIQNAQALAKKLQKEGVDIVSGGTDNHLMLLNVKSLGLTGKVAEKVLDDIGITVNKNTIPFDTESPFVTSGIRIGTAAVTSRGFMETEMETIGELIAKALKNHEDKTILAACSQSVLDLTKKFPLYEVL